MTLKEAQALTSPLSAVGMGALARLSACVPLCL